MKNMQLLKLYLTINYKPKSLNNGFLSVSDRPVASSIIGGGGGGGHIFIYSCAAQLVSFEIYCFYGLLTRTYEYVPPPPPPPPIIELATGLVSEESKTCYFSYIFSFSSLISDFLDRISNK